MNEPNHSRVFLQSLLLSYIIFTLLLYEALHGLFLSYVMHFMKLAYIQTDSIRVQNNSPLYFLSLMCLFETKIIFLII